MITQIKTVAHEAKTEVTGSNQTGIYKLSGATALILLIYSLATMVILIVIGGQPETAQQGFTMLQDNRLVGLLRLDILTTLVMPLYYLLFWGLYTALKKTDGAYAALATALAFAGLTLFLSAPAAFNWLAVSDKFAAATTEAQRSLLLAAGEAILASDLWHGSGAIMGGLILQIAALLISVVMLRSKLFGRLTSIVGVLTHGLDLAHLVVGLVFPIGGVILMAIAGPLYLVWFPALARDFFRLGRENS